MRIKAGPPVERVITIEMRESEAKLLWNILQDVPLKVIKGEHNGFFNSLVSNLQQTIGEGDWMMGQEKVDLD